MKACSRASRLLRWVRSSEVVGRGGGVGDGEAVGGLMLMLMLRTVAQAVARVWVVDFQGCAGGGGG